jgi:RNA polymerase sigma-70 factor (ECF subfamily)
MKPGPSAPAVGATDSVTETPADPSISSTLARLFLEHNRSLQSFLRVRVGSQHDAEEIAQEAYARLLQLGSPGAIGYLRAYLFRIATHIAIDRARQQAARFRIDKTLEVAETSDPVTPELQLLAAQQLELFERTLRELPANYRRAFLMYRFKERSTQQIAMELGIGERMARNYVSRSARYCKLRMDGKAAAEARREVMP